MRFDLARLPLRLDDWPPLAREWMAEREAFGWLAPEHHRNAEAIGRWAERLTREWWALLPESQRR